MEATSGQYSRVPSIPAPPHPETLPPPAALPTYTRRASDGFSFGQEPRGSSPKTTMSRLAMFFYPSIVPGTCRSLSSR